MQEDYTSQIKMLPILSEKEFRGYKINTNILTNRSIKNDA
jgi:hypothetical protein